MATKYRLKRKYRIRLHNTTLSMIVLSLVIGLASFTLVNTSASGGGYNFSRVGY